MTEGSLHRQKWKAAIRLFFWNSSSVLAGSLGHATFALEKASNTPAGMPWGWWRRSRDKDGSHKRRQRDLPIRAYRVPPPTVWPLFTSSNPIGFIISKGISVSIGAEILFFVWGERIYNPNFSYGEFATIRKPGRLKQIKLAYKKLFSLKIMPLCH